MEDNVKVIPPKDQTSINERVDQIKTWLREGVCKVEFVKKNGETRILYGTINPEIIQSYNPQPENLNNRFDDSLSLPIATKVPRIIQKPIFNIAVFDTRKLAWRSFNVDQMVSIFVEKTDATNK